MKTEIDIRFFDGTEYTLLRDRLSGSYSIRNNFTGEEVPADEELYLKIFPDAYNRMMANAEKQADKWIEDLRKDGTLKEWQEQIRRNKQKNDEGN